jgi:hypothetical protein
MSNSDVNCCTCGAPQKGHKCPEPKQHKPNSRLRREKTYMAWNGKENIKKPVPTKD